MHCVVAGVYEPHMLLVMIIVQGGVLIFRGALLEGTY